MCCKVLRCTSDVKINAKHEFHACFYAWWYGKNSLFCPFFSQIYLISCNIFFSFFSYFSSIFFRKNEKIFFSEKKKKKIFLGMSSTWTLATNTTSHFIRMHLCLTFDFETIFIKLSFCFVCLRDCSSENFICPETFGTFGILGYWQLPFAAKI